jgi:hypothetical protein
MLAGPQRNARVLIVDANARERTVAGSEGVVKGRPPRRGSMYCRALCESVRVARKEESRSLNVDVPTAGWPETGL